MRKIIEILVAIFAFGPTLASYAKKFIEFNEYIEFPNKFKEFVARAAELSGGANNSLLLVGFAAIGFLFYDTFYPKTDHDNRRSPIAGLARVPIPYLIIIFGSALVMVAAVWAAYQATTTGTASPSKEVSSGPPSAKPLGPTERVSAVSGPPHKSYFAREKIALGNALSQVSEILSNKASDMTELYISKYSQAIDPHINPDAIISFNSSVLGGLLGVRGKLIQVLNENKGFREELRYVLDQKNQYSDENFQYLDEYRGAVMNFNEKTKQYKNVQMKIIDNEVVAFISSLLLDRVEPVRHQAFITKKWIAECNTRIDQERGVINR